MKRIRIIALILAVAVLLAGAALSEDACGPGLVRAAGATGYAQAGELAGRYGVALTDGAPLYAPAHPQPMNAYMVVDAECQVGIDGDDLYAVAEKGLIPEITGYLEAWMGEIEAASGGAIRFVADPDDADVLVAARQSFEYYGQYSGGGLSAEGYACVVTLTARQLTDPDNRCALTETRTPEETVTLHGGARFWKTPPVLKDTDKLYRFACDILQWYGFGAKRGDRGAGVAAAQRALIDRGLLTGSADGSFGPKTEAAMKRLQEARGLSPCEYVDLETLLALYYDGEA